MFVYAFIRSKLCITPMMMFDDYFLMLEFILIKTMFRLLSHNDEDKWRYNYFPLLMKRIFWHNVNVYALLICYELRYMFHEGSILMYVFKYSDNLCTYLCGGNQGVTNTMHQKLLFSALFLHFLVFFSVSRTDASYLTSTWNKHIIPA